MTPPSPIKIPIAWCHWMSCVSWSSKESSANSTNPSIATGGAHAAVENATRIGQGIAERLKVRRRHRRHPHLDLRLEHSLRRSDQ